MRNLLKMSVIITFIVCCWALCGAQVQYPEPNINLQTILSQRIGNFSIEILYHTARTLQEGQNFIMSPIAVWNMLALIAEGATGSTRRELHRAIIWDQKDSDAIRVAMKNITQWTRIRTDTVVLAKINLMFVDRDRLPLPDFQDLAKREYDTDSVNFTYNVNAVKLLNNVINSITLGLIKKIVEPDYLQNTTMVLTNALYFKGQWSVPFNASSTTKMPFYNSKREKIGEVNMMYNKFTYPYAYIKELQARVIEIPYGNEDKLSMLFMLPNRGLSVEDMFLNFLNITLDTLFKQLKVIKEKHSDNDVDCFIPRFKISTELDLSNVIKYNYGVWTVFDPLEARLPYIAREPLHVSKIVHKVEIEVIEEGTAAGAVPVPEFSNRIGAVQFQANRPFSYYIVDKVTNSFVFAGFYKTPSVY